MLEFPRPARFSGVSRRARCLPCCGLCTFRGSSDQCIAFGSFPVHVLMLAVAQKLPDPVGSEEGAEMPVSTSNPSRSRDRVQHKPRCSRLLISDSPSECLRPVAAKGASDVRVRSSADSLREMPGKALRCRYHAIALPLSASAAARSSRRILG